MVCKCVLSPDADWLRVAFTAKTTQNSSEDAKMLLTYVLPVTGEKKSYLVGVTWEDTKLGQQKQVT